LTTSLTSFTAICPAWSSTDAVALKKKKWLRLPAVRPASRKINKKR
jgi:hypothetical protein